MFYNEFKLKLQVSLQRLAQFKKPIYDTNKFNPNMVGQFYVISYIINIYTFFNFNHTSLHRFVTL